MAGGLKTKHLVRPHPEPMSGGTTDRSGDESENSLLMDPPMFPIQVSYGTSLQPPLIPLIFNEGKLHPSSADESNDCPDCSLQLSTPDSMWVSPSPSTTFCCSCCENYITEQYGQPIGDFPSSNKQYLSAWATERLESAPPDTKKRCSIQYAQIYADDWFHTFVHWKKQFDQWLSDHERSIPAPPPVLKALPPLPILNGLCRSMDCEECVTCPTCAGKGMVARSSIVSESKTTSIVSKAENPTLAPTTTTTAPTHARIDIPEEATETTETAATTSRLPTRPHTRHDTRHIPMSSPSSPSPSLSSSSTMKGTSSIYTSESASSASVSSASVSSASASSASASSASVSSSSASVSRSAGVDTVITQKSVREIETEMNTSVLISTFVNSIYNKDDEKVAFAFDKECQSIKDELRYVEWLIGQYMNDSIKREDHIDVYIKITRRWINKLKSTMHNVEDGGHKHRPSTVIPNVSFCLDLYAEVRRVFANLILIMTGIRSPSLPLYVPMTIISPSEEWTERERMSSLMLLQTAYKRWDGRLAEVCNVDFDCITRELEHLKVDFKTSRIEWIERKSVHPNANAAELSGCIREVSEYVRMRTSPLVFDIFSCITKSLHDKTVITIREWDRFSEHMPIKTHLWRTGMIRMTSDAKSTTSAAATTSTATSTATAATAVAESTVDSMYDVEQQIFSSIVGHGTLATVRFLLAMLQWLCPSDHWIRKIQGRSGIVMIEKIVRLYCGNKSFTVDADVHVHVEEHLIHLNIRLLTFIRDILTMIQHNDTMIKRSIPKKMDPTFRSGSSGSSGGSVVVVASTHSSTLLSHTTQPRSTFTREPVRTTPLR